MDQNGKYYEPLVGSNPDNVYDALTVLDENAEKMFRRMNTCVKRGGGDDDGRRRRPEVVVRHVRRTPLRCPARVAGDMPAGRVLPDAEWWLFHATRVNIGSNRTFRKMKWQTRVIPKKRREMERERVNFSLLSFNF